MFQLVLNLAVVYLVLGAFRRWPATGPPPRGVVIRLVGAGFVFGGVCIARPYDALLFAVPIVIAAAIAMRRTYRRLLMAAAYSVLGAAIPRSRRCSSSTPR